MRLPLKYTFNILKLGKKRLKLHFAKRFKTKEILISIGCNCHPAHLLAIMRFRKTSLPFDWLLTDGDKGLNYVTDNIKNSFQNFMADLQINAQNFAFAKKYPESCFYHHSDIISNPQTRNTFQNRINRFTEIINNSNCTFLYALPSENLNSIESVHNIASQAEQFSSTMKEKDKLCIYITYNEKADLENKYCDDFIKDIRKLKNVYSAKFLLEAKKYGLWGYENNYEFLLRDLNISFSKKFPDLKLSFSE